SKEEVDKWAKVRLEITNSQRTSHPKIPLLPPITEATESRNLGGVILQRGSTRRFSRLPIKLSQLSAILRTSTGPIPRDYLPEKENLIETYFIANAVEGLAPGSYFYSGEQNSLEELKRGELRQMSAYLCLGQPLFGDASGVFFLMTRLREVLGALGNCGYGPAQPGGAIVAGKLYL